jgi:peptidoglycan/LPS O-acetylase OafA/YrhL
MQSPVDRHPGSPLRCAVMRTIVRERVTVTEERNPHGDGRYIPMLDGWRAVAILLVLLFHGMYNSDLAGHPWLTGLAVMAGRTGALGVLVFFCISGYLITKRLLLESRLLGMFSIRSFYIKRAFRILPPLAVYLFVAVALYFGGIIALRSGDWSALVFLSNYYKGSWYTSHFWSLSVEEHFYLFWPICAVALGWRRAMWVGVALICAVAVWRPWRLQHVISQAGTLRHTDMRIDYILMGAVVALATEFYPWTITVLKWLGRSSGLTVLFLLLLVSTRSTSLDTRTVQAVLLTLIVCASTVANAPLARLVLTNRPVLFLGKVSYSLYVWQQLFLGRTGSTFWDSPYMLPTKYVGALLTAWASYRFVEKPFIRYGRNVIARKKY